MLRAPGGPAPLLASGGAILPLSPSLVVPPLRPAQDWGGWGRGFSGAPVPNYAGRPFISNSSPCWERRPCSAALRKACGRPPPLPERDACPAFSPFCFPLLFRSAAAKILLQRVEISTESRPGLLPLKAAHGNSLALRDPCPVKKKKKKAAF